MFILILIIRFIDESNCLKPSLWKIHSFNIISIHIEQPQFVLYVKFSVSIFHVHVYIS